jgi:putative CRISPR-associated protein (TIGR02619 family)
MTTKNNKIRIITTVGTSLFSNFQLDNKDNEEWANLKEDRNGKEPYPKRHFEEKVWGKCIEEWNTNENTFKSDVKKWAITNKKKSKEKSCAELQSINQIAKGYKEVELILLSSYTLDGYLAATIIKELLNENILEFPCNVVLDETPIEGLVVDNADTFQNKGFQEIVKLLKHHSTEKIKNTDVVFNVSGGFKAVIPVVTLISQIQSLPLKYIYEDSEKVISLGNLPISFDWAKAERFYLLLEKESINYINSLSSFSEQDLEVINELRDFKLLNGNRDKDKKDNFSLSSLGTFFNVFINDVMPVGKSVLGVLMEYKIVENFLFSKEVYPYYNICRSIDIENVVDEMKNPKGNEVDILLEPISKSNVFNEIREKGKKNESTPIEFIPIEVKPLSTNPLEKDKNGLSQFEEWLKRIEKHWSPPKEIWYIFYSFIPEIYVSQKKKDFKDKFTKMNQKVNEVFGNNHDISFKIFLINEDIKFEKEGVTIFMQTPISQNFIAQPIYTSPKKENK